MKRQRMRQTDTHEAHVYTGWTAMKQETFCCVFKSSHPDISDTIPTNQRLFYFTMEPRMSESDWLVHLKQIK